MKTDTLANAVTFTSLPCDTHQEEKDDWVLCSTIANDPHQKQTDNGVLCSTIGNDPRCPKETCHEDKDRASNLPAFVSHPSSEVDSRGP